MAQQEEDVLDVFLTSSALRKFNGKSGGSNNKIYMSIMGMIYDCTENGEQHFGSGGSYQKFAGRDITYALGKMSLKPHHIDVFDYQLSDDQKNTISEWVAYYEARYKIVGFVVDIEHPVDLTSLCFMSAVQTNYDFCLVLAVQCHRPPSNEAEEDAWLVKQTKNASLIFLLTIHRHHVRGREPKGENEKDVGAAESLVGASLLSIFCLTPSLLLC